MHYVLCLILLSFSSVPNPSGRLDRLSRKRTSVKEIPASVIYSETYHHERTFDFNESVCDLNRYGNCWGMSVGCLIYLCFSSQIFFLYINESSIIMSASCLIGLKCSFLTVRKVLLLIRSNHFKKKFLRFHSWSFIVVLRLTNIHRNDGPHLSSTSWIQTGLCINPMYQHLHLGFKYGKTFHFLLLVQIVCKFTHKKVKKSKRLEQEEEI